MLNAMGLREKAPRARGSELRRQPSDVDAEISELASRIVSLQSRARKSFDDYVATINRLVQIAREMAPKL
ncbi:MAG: hypothetical protein ACXU89_19355 [Xanthobacteraceae bacterium]